jgi:hypothetical protein
MLIAEMLIADRKINSFHSAFSTQQSAFPIIHISAQGLDRSGSRGVRE